MHFLQAINSDISVLIVCNKTGGTIKGDKKYEKEVKKYMWKLSALYEILRIVMEVSQETGDGVDFPVSN